MMTGDASGTEMSLTCSEMHNINNILQHTAVKSNAPLIAVCANVAGVENEYKCVMMNTKLANNYVMPRSPRGTMRIPANKLLAIHEERTSCL